MITFITPSKQPVNLKNNISVGRGLLMPFPPLLTYPALTYREPTWASHCARITALLDDYTYSRHQTDHQRAGHVSLEIA